jgi:antitoxin MazE
MNTVIRKWGNSPAVRLPVSVMSAAKLELEQKVQVTVEDGRIIIEPVGGAEYSLDQLVAGITRKNSHGEAGFGAPVGKEAL